jgi:hypothetical protein
LEQFERLSAFDELDVWMPVRHHFGIEAFGINAFAADQAGRRVIEEHDELAEADQGRHEELYVVLRGNALFALGGEEIEAPAGTFVFIRDPAVRRGAIAGDGGAAVLALGARPGRAFTASPWEYRFRARAKGGEAGMAIVREGLDRYPDDPTLHYDLACHQALVGDCGAALASLRSAISISAAVREWAAQDSDFDSLREDPEFQALLAA